MKLSLNRQQVNHKISIREVTHMKWKMIVPPLPNSLCPLFILTKGHTASSVLLRMSKVVHIYIYGLHVQGDCFVVQSSLTSWFITDFLSGVLIHSLKRHASAGDLVRTFSLALVSCDWDVCFWFLETSNHFILEMLYLSRKLLSLMWGWFKMMTTCVILHSKEIKNHLELLPNSQALKQGTLPPRPLKEK